MHEHTKRKTNPVGSASAWPPRTLTSTPPSAHRRAQASRISNGAKTDSCGPGRRRGAVHQRMTATYSVDRFIDLLIDAAEDEHGQPLEEIRLTKLEFARLAADAVDAVGCLDCAWCGVDTGELGEYFMVSDAIWTRYGPARGGACVRRDQRQAVLPVARGRPARQRARRPRAVTPKRGVGQAILP